MLLSLVVGGARTELMDGQRRPWLVALLREQRPVGPSLAEMLEAARASSAAVHPWWPERAQAAWRSMTPRQRRQARLVMARVEHRYRGLVIGQLRLTRDLKRRGLAPGPGIAVVRELTRRGLLRRRRIGTTTLLWMPRDLRGPPDEPAHPPEGEAQEDDR